MAGERKANPTNLKYERVCVSMHRKIKVLHQIQVQTYKSIRYAVEEKEEEGGGAEEGRGRRVDGRFCFL